MPSGSDAGGLRLGGLVLAGGASARMGRPKAWLPFPAPSGGEEPLLARVVRRIAPAVGPLVVVAAEGQPLPPLPAGVEVVRDPIAGKGPLVGILAGLSALGDRVDAAFVTTTDAPFVGAALVRRLAELWTADHDLIVPRVGDHHQVLAALYAVSARPHVEALLAEDLLAVHRLLERARTRIVSAAELLEDAELAREDPELCALTSVNTVEAYEAALAVAQGER